MIRGMPDEDAPGIFFEGSANIIAQVDGLLVNCRR